MKKILKIILLSIIIIMNINLVVEAAKSETSRLKLKVVEVEEDYEIYILLSKKYIMYAIQHDGLNINYDKANTIKYNYIPSIMVDINNVQEEVYVDEGIEYVQIKLNNLGGEEYLFEIIPEYTDMDMLYRVKSKSKDELMIINNFKIIDNTCNIEYNYRENTVKSESESETKFKINLSWWQIVLIIILIIFLVYIFNRRNY